MCVGHFNVEPPTGSVPRFLELEKSSEFNLPIDQPMLPQWDF